MLASYCYNKINESINECLNEIHGMYGMRTEWGEAIDEIDPLILTNEVTEWTVSEWSTEWGAM